VPEPRGYEWVGLLGTYPIREISNQTIRTSASHSDTYLPTCCAFTLARPVRYQLRAWEPCGKAAT
jgi:hypothetical protein